MSDGHWDVRLATRAASDLADIVAWTATHFGTIQARVYADTVNAAVIELRAGPQINGVRSRTDLGADLYTLHVARHNRRGRHFILFRVAAAGRTIEVLRILHDAMDVAHHVPDEEP